MNIKNYYQIDKSSPVPLYFQIKETMISLIKNNTYQMGEQLPTEIEFCIALDISRPTIRQAFQALEKEGYIERKKAKGTFVRAPKVDGFFFQKLNSFNEEMKQLNLIPSTKVLTQEIIEADDFLADTLQISVHDQVLHLERLRFANDDIMVYVNTYVPIVYAPNLVDYDFAQPDSSLYDVFTQYQSPIAYVDRVVEALNADTKLANILDIKKNDAIYSITTHAYNKQDNIQEYSIAHYRGDRNKFSLRLIQR